MFFGRVSDMIRSNHAQLFDLLMNSTMTCEEKAHNKLYRSAVSVPKSDLEPTRLIVRIPSRSERAPPALTRQRLSGAAEPRPAGHRCASSASRAGPPRRLLSSAGGRKEPRQSCWDSLRAGAVCVLSPGPCVAGVEQRYEGLFLTRGLGILCDVLFCVALFQAAAGF